MKNKGKISKIYSQNFKKYLHGPMNYEELGIDLEIA